MISAISTDLASSSAAASEAARSAAPALGPQDIVCISSIDWDFIWQGHQEIMSRLAEQGHRVLFIENTGVRAVQFRDLPRLTQRIRNWWRGTKGFRQERENLFVYSPVLLPFPYSRLARWINQAMLLRALRRWMHASGFRRPVIWTFLPTPLARDLIRELDPELTVYHCTDDFSSSSKQARRIKGVEERVFREADLVFVTSSKLRDRAQRFNRQVHLFPSGVNLRRFEEARERSDGLPEDLRRLPRPVIGYVGGVHQWLDQELLAAAAVRMPEASFVLVGPVQTELSRLARLPNVHLLGARAHADVPAYIKGFDVGIVPYRLSEYTSHVYPTKLNEYFAMGIPVVTTDLLEIRRFNEQHGELVGMARGPDAFVEVLRGALASAGDAALALRRIEAAGHYDWGVIVRRMSGVIAERLAWKRAVGRRWEEALRRLYRAARQRAVRTALVLAVTFGAVFWSPALWWVATPLTRASAPKPVDAIVVFAGGVGESGKAGGGYQERVKQAVDLYREGLAPQLVFSSGYTFVFQEAEVMKELAVGHGVPASAIILETDAANTLENVQFVRRILEARGLRSILLVSSPYHMRRALATWRKQAPEIEVVPSPVAQSQFYAHARGASLEQIRGIAHEYAGIVYYWWKGWL